MDKTPRNQPSSTANTQTPSLARTSRILPELMSFFRARGVIDEELILQLGYLVLTSRFTDRPLCMVLVGPSGGGKSYLLNQICSVFPQSAYYEATALSQMAPAYMKSGLRHRILVVHEAAGLPTGRGTQMLRSLVTEGHIRYTTVAPAQSGWKGKEIVVPGPTGLLMTNVKEVLDDELMTRLIVVPIDTSKQQTTAILRAGSARRRPRSDDPRARPWLELQEWIEHQAHSVHIPYAKVLGAHTLSVAVRQRRDQGTLQGLIESHTLLHQANRLTSKKTGKILATLEDYDAVYPLYRHVMSEQLGSAIPESIRQVVQALVELTDTSDSFEDGVSVSAVARNIGWDVNYAWRQVQLAESRGYLRNEEQRQSRPAKLVLGEPIPDAEDVLPSPKKLRRLLARVRRSRP